MIDNKPAIIVVAGVLIVLAIVGGAMMMHGADQVGTGEDVGFRP